MGTIAASTIAEETLARAGVHPIARVCEGRATDFAFISHTKRSVVVRCVEEPTKADYRALAGMIDQGDFDRAILVYCDSEQPRLSDAIESWPISRFNELAASLARDSNP